MLGFVGYIYFNIKIAPGKSSENKIFEILPEDGTFLIADNLKAKGLVRSAIIFAYYAKIKGVTFYPGEYYLRENMNMDEILMPLKNKEIKEYKITIPEGWRITQIADYLNEKNIVKKDDFIFSAKDKEGYLFPDTYRLSIDVTADEIVSKMVENYNTRTRDIKVSKDDLILASIVEREAKNNDDRAKIAGVFMNRVSNNMFLGSDATVEYAKGNWLPITKKDIETVDSPFNTYKYKGLPPAPICNPGLLSIKAAIKPESVDWFYFFTLKDGSAVFSRTGYEHDLNLEKYKDQIDN
jgi:UPF0755 protein